MLPQLQDLRPIFVMEMVQQRFKREDPLEYFLVPPTDKEQQSIWRGSWGTIAEQLFTTKEQKNLAPIVARYLPKPNSLKELCPVTATVLGFFKQYGQAVVYKTRNRTYLVKYQFEGKWQYVLLGHWLGGNLTLDASDFAECMASLRLRNDSDKLAGWIFLTKLLKQSVEHTFRRASEDFDNACVVTTDGKYIIKAAKVRIIRQDGTSQEVSGSTFSENKILFPDGEEGGNWMSLPTTTAELAERITYLEKDLRESSKYGGHYIRPCDRGEYPSVFLVHERFVPSGISLTVH